MAVTMQDVRSHLDRDEPDYLAAASLGPEALPHLMKLVLEPDPMTASKAAYLAAMINAEESPEVLEAAAHSPSPQVRVAAAAGTRHLSSLRAPGLVDVMLDDPDAGVRKVAVRTAAALRDPQLRQKVEHLTSDPIVGDIATRVLSDWD